MKGQCFPIDKQTRSSEQRFAEVFRFAVNGGVCFLIEYGLLYALTEFAGMYYLVSSAISFTVSVFVNYLICIFWVFQGTKNSSTKSKLVFIGSSMVGLLIKDRKSVV